MSYRSAIRLSLTGIAMLAVFASPVAAMTQAGTAQSGSSATAQPLTRARLSAQLDSNFKAVDSNGDKTLSAAEIETAQARTIAQAQATIAKRIEAEFARLDANKDGQLSMAEMKAGAPTPRATPAAELLGQLDRNKDGKATLDEYRATPLANFDRLDTNKDGTISAAEQSAASRR